MKVGKDFGRFDQENGANPVDLLSARQQAVQNKSHSRDSYVEDIAFVQPVLIAPSSRIH